jgi:hypothetical protein
MYVDLLNDEFALLVLLARLVRLHVRPSHHGLTTLTEDVTNRMQTSHQDPFLSWSDGNVDTVIKQECPA